MYKKFHKLRFFLEVILNFLIHSVRIYCFNVVISFIRCIFKYNVFQYIIKKYFKIEYF